MTPWVIHHISGTAWDVRFTPVATGSLRPTN